MEGKLSGPKFTRFEASRKALIFSTLSMSLLYKKNVLIHLFNSLAQKFLKYYQYLNNITGLVVVGGLQVEHWDHFWLSLRAMGLFWFSSSLVFQRHQRPRRLLLPPLQASEYLVLLAVRSIPWFCSLEV